MPFTESTKNPHFPEVLDINPIFVSKNLNHVKLIDVRGPDEYTGELGHVLNSELIVLQTIPQHFESIPKDKPIVLICRSGARSAQAAQFLLSQGFKDVYNMQGGMILWNQHQLPVEKNEK